MPSHTPAALETMTATYCDMAKAAKAAFKCIRKDGRLRFPKFHVGIHYEDEIYLYGVLISAESDERAHKIFCKIPYSLTNKNASFSHQVVPPPPPQP